jgi:hypothetical protein
VRTTETVSIFERVPKKHRMTKGGSLPALRTGMRNGKIRKAKLQEIEKLYERFAGNRINPLSLGIRL